MQHAKLTAREQARLEACSSEPIRTPGSIQPHGVFFAVEQSTHTIVVHSENAHSVLGIDPSSLLGTSIDDILSPGSARSLLEPPLAANPLDLQIGGEQYDAIVHSAGSLLFVELEPHAPFRERDSSSAALAAAHRLSAHGEKPALLTEVAREFSALAGFDRTMVYHFHPDRHGEVVAEVHADGMDPYLGLHFPASDIPVQARALYLTKLSRAIVSTDNAPSPLLALADLVPTPLDLSSAELRSVSPFHLQFMRNMGQASTVSFSLIHRGELIGMITCAHRVERRLPFLIRKSLEVLANQVALQLGAIDTIAALNSEIHSRDLRSQLLGKIVASDNLSGALLAGHFTLLDVIAADAAVVCLDGVRTRTAWAPTGAESDAVLRKLSATNVAMHSDSLGLTHPEIAERVEGFSGLLFVPVGHDGDFLAFFRREVARSIDWLGDLTDQNRSEVLSPRLSFSAWRESVTGRSLPWDDLPTSAAALARDIESALLRRRESRLATLAMVDPLTGLANRRHLMEMLTTAPTASVVSLLFADLDDFKSINDTHGHEAGDAVIIEVGKRLSSQTRAQDFVVRLGGDEFVIMCADLPPADAHALARRVAEAIRAPIQLPDCIVTITASVGVVTVPAEVDASDMLEQADAAMYRAKQTGKDQVSV